MNKIDMSWGSPAFLIPYWKSFSVHGSRQFDREMAYSFGSKDSLKTVIKKIHEQENNAEVKDKHIVVAAGATQIVLGLLHVLSGIKDTDSAWANPPHFSRFPHLAEFAGLKWQKKNNPVLISTIPNNPDGSLFLHKDTDILDLTYNWPQYVHRVKKYDHPVMVFSLSKATGHASTRIGWAILEDELVAKALEQYIEYSTSGLSIDAQNAAEAILNDQLESSFTVFEDGKKTLEDRIELIKEIQQDLPFQVISLSGMFLWARGECPKEIIGLDGRSLKGPKGTFRLNIGCSSENFITFYNLFAKHPLDDDAII